MREREGKEGERKREEERGSERKRERKVTVCISKMAARKI